MPFATVLRENKRALKPILDRTRHVPCVVKVALEELDEGQILSIKMNEGEPVQNVPRSIKEEGHQILKLLDNSDGTYELIVRKVGDD